MDRLLGELGGRGLPPAPDLRREVRAEIARRKAHPSFWQRLLPVLSWNELLLQPRIAIGALSLALAAGILPGVLGTASSDRAGDARIARASLHLDVFSAAENGAAMFAPVSGR